MWWSESELSRLPSSRTLGSSAISAMPTSLRRRLRPSWRRRNARENIWIDIYGEAKLKGTFASAGGF